MRGLQTNCIVTGRLVRRIGRLLRVSALLKRGYSRRHRSCRGDGRRIATRMAWRLPRLPGEGGVEGAVGLGDSEADGYWVVFMRMWVAKAGAEVLVASNSAALFGISFIPACIHEMDGAGSVAVRISSKFPSALLSSGGVGCAVDVDVEVANGTIVGSAADGGNRGNAAEAVDDADGAGTSAIDAYACRAT